MGTSTTGGTYELIISLLPMILIFALLYLMMIRPQRKQQKQLAAMRAALKVGDKVVTIGGICGKVAKIKDEFVYIETGMPGQADSRAYIKFKKSAIDSVDPAKDDKKAATPIPDSEEPEE